MSRKEAKQILIRIFGFDRNEVRRIEKDIEKRKEKDAGIQTKNRD